MYSTRKNKVKFPERRNKSIRPPHRQNLHDVACNDEVLLKDNYLQLKLKDKILGEHPKLSGQKRTK